MLRVSTSRFVSRALAPLAVLSLSALVVQCGPEAYHSLQGAGGRGGAAGGTGGVGGAGLAGATGTAGDSGAAGTPPLTGAAGDLGAAGTGAAGTGAAGTGAAGTGAAGTGTAGTGAAGTGAAGTGAAGTGAAGSGAAGTGAAGTTGAGGAGGKAGTGGTPDAGSDAAVAPTDMLKVQYECRQNGPSVLQAEYSIKVVNVGTTDIPLNNVSVRYWYTIDGTGAQAGNCASTNHPCTIAFQSTAAKPTADQVAVISFANGTLAKGADTGEVQLEMRGTGMYNQTNDYSLRDMGANLVDEMHVTGYIGGKLVWGTPP